MSKDDFTCTIFNGVTYVLAFIQTNQVFQIVEMILAILTSLIILGYRLWKWWIEAKKDGKITKEEIKDVADIVAKGIEDIKDKRKEKDDERKD